MNFDNLDWFVYVNDTYQPLLRSIADLDKNIKDERNPRIREAKKKERNKLWDNTWERVAAEVPCYSSQLALLASMSFMDKSLEDSLRERYIEVIHKRGKKIIQDRLKLARLDGFFRAFSVPHITNLNMYPRFSFFLQFEFTLARPYLSKDDEEFYIIDNPVRKDKVFKVPMVAASSWKGNLRWTAREIEGLNPAIPDNSLIKRLFGKEKTSEEETEQDFNRGRLQFYPTFFYEIGLEVINPHDRRTKAGTNPIYIESVPDGAKGTFSLLYVPFDLLGKPESDVSKEVREDLNLVYRSVSAMMLTYGFSAKKSSGFGVIKDGFEKDDRTPSGIILMRGGSPEQGSFSNFSEMYREIEKMLGYDGRGK
jgi:CRISPR-associated protein Cmr2